MSGVHDRSEKMYRAFRDAVTTGTLTLVGAINAYYNFHAWYWWALVAVVGIATIVNLSLGVLCYFSEDLGPMP